MFTAFAPPAIRYPPIATSSTSESDGVPATNIGAIVVTSSSEMMRGFVSITRSRTSVRVSDAATLGRHRAAAHMPPPRAMITAMLGGSGAIAGDARYASERRHHHASQMNTPSIWCSDRSAGGRCMPIIAPAMSELQQHQREHHAHAAHGGGCAGELPRGDHQPEEVQEQEEREHAMRHLDAHEMLHDRRRPPTFRTAGNDRQTTFAPGTFAVRPPKMSTSSASRRPPPCRGRISRARWRARRRRDRRRARAPRRASRAARRRAPSAPSSRAARSGRTP